MVFKFKKLKKKQGNYEQIYTNDFNLKKHLQQNKVT